MARIRRFGNGWSAEIEQQVYGVPTGVVAEGRTVSLTLHRLADAYRKMYERTPEQRRAEEERRRNVEFRDVRIHDPEGEA